jgi:biopolymer transport protein ExbD
MSRRRVYTSVQANMTPLIDVVFLLIVFFVLVSRIVDEDRPRLDLPSPTPAATMVPPPGPRAIVSVVDGEPATYQLAGTAYDTTDTGRAALGSALADLLRRSPDTSVQVRAARSTSWDLVAPVLEEARSASQAAGLGGEVRVQLATIREHLP